MDNRLDQISRDRDQVANLGGKKGTTDTSQFEMRPEHQSRAHVKRMALRTEITALPARPEGWQ